MVRRPDALPCTFMSQVTVNHGEALHQLRMARELAVWFQRSFGNNRKFDPGPFVPPTEPRRAFSLNLS
jgi:hypothetical protein